MEQSKHTFGWKQLLCVALAAALLIAGGFGLKALLSRDRIIALCRSSRLRPPIWINSV